MLSVYIRLVIIAIISLLPSSVNSIPVSGLNKEEWSELSDIIEINDFDPN